jgi:hypothetical protein
MSEKSFVVLSIAISILYPLLAIVMFLFGVNIGIFKSGIKDAEEEFADSGYVPYKPKDKYRAYVPGKEIDEELD